MIVFQCEPYKSHFSVSIPLCFVVIISYYYKWLNCNYTVLPILSIYLCLHTQVSIWALSSLYITSNIVNPKYAIHSWLWFNTNFIFCNTYCFPTYSFSCVFNCMHTHSDDTDLNTNNNSNTNSDHLVVNLSDCELTVHQKRLLSKGLKFCPNPGEPDFREYKDDLDRFHLRLKRELHFNVVTDPDSSLDSSSDHSINLTTPRIDPMEPFSDQKFKLPSDWILPGTLRVLYTAK